MKSRKLRVGRGVFVCLLAAMTPLFADVLPSGLKIDQVLDNAAELGAMEISPTGEIWLLERTSGTVRVYVAGQQKASLTIPVTPSCDSGLLDLAFAPDYFSSGLTFLSYVDDAGNARVDRLYSKGVELQLGGNVLMLGTPIDGCRPGGGLSVGPDEKLYIGVGDMGVALDAQDNSKITGKVLRANLDGSVPAGNSSGTLVWAKGFRHGADLDVGSNGTVYLADQGEDVPGAVFDETNAVLEGNNHGWDIFSGHTGGFYDDPLTAHLPVVMPDGVNLLGPGLGEGHEDTLTYACRVADDIRQVVLKGPDLDQLDHMDVFYDPLGDAAGIPDAECPKRFDTLAEAADGWLYGANSGANPGIWRIWHDTPGPREVSAPGSPLQLTVAKVMTAIELEWEDLGARDAHLARRPGIQPAQTYRIWQGTLPFSGYDHTTYFSADGTPSGVARLKQAFTPSTRSSYYLISAQGDNMEGSLGKATSGAERPGGGEDYCDGIGYGTGTAFCAEDWVNPLNPSEPQPLIDSNPYSETYMQAINLSDFRGRVLRVDISALNCTYCRLQAPFAADVEHDYAARDMLGITIMTQSYTTLAPIPELLCEAAVTSWADTYGVTNPIVCDIDTNGDGKGDATWQWWNAGCGGTPQNFYIDQGFHNYNFTCGGELTYLTIENKVKNEVNPQICE